MTSDMFNGLAKALQCLPAPPVDDLFDDLLARLDAVAAPTRTFGPTPKPPLKPGGPRRVLQARQRRGDHAMAQLLMRRCLAMAADGEPSLQPDPASAPLVTAPAG